MRPRGHKLTVDGAAAAGRVGVAEVAVGGAGCETPGGHAAAVDAWSVHREIKRF